MLTLVQAQRRQTRRRHSPSLKQLYQEYILERIEAYKNSITRADLLRLGDEAVAELQATSEGQFVLTEVLMLESVDRLIIKRLSLPSYPKWRRTYVALRTAQREPTHWGLDPRDPVTSLLPRLEPGDQALLIGTAAEPLAFLLAAHEVAVTFLAGDLPCVERVENRAAGESLTAGISAFVVQLGGWLPDTGAQSVVAIDTGAIEDIGTEERAAVIGELQTRTADSGVHVLLGSGEGLAPAALLGHYEAWQPDPHLAKSRPSRPRSLVLNRPPPEAGRPAGDLSASR